MNFFQSAINNSTSSVLSSTAATDSNSVEVFVFPGGRKVLNFTDGQTLSDALTSNNISFPSSAQFEITANGVTAQVTHNTVLHAADGIERITVSPMVKGNEGDDDAVKEGENSQNDERKARYEKFLNESEKVRLAHSSFHDKVKEYLGVDDFQVSAFFVCANDRGSFIWAATRLAAEARFDLLSSQLAKLDLKNDPVKMASFVQSFVSLCNTFKTEARALSPIIKRVFTNSAIEQFSIDLAQITHDNNAMTAKQKDARRAMNNALLAQAAAAIGDTSKLDEALAETVSVLATKDNNPRYLSSHTVDYVYNNAALKAQYTKISDLLRLIVSGVTTYAMYVDDNIFSNPFATGAEIDFHDALIVLDQSAKEIHAVYDRIVAPTRVNSMYL